MCGRFTLTATGEELAEAFELEIPPQVAAPRYNIAPSQNVLVVRQAAGRRMLASVRWGMAPPWVPPGRHLINARFESAASRPAFRDALRQRRCLVPATGFFEWKNEAGHRQPFLFRRQDRRPFALAGLLDTWQAPDSALHESCAILTCPPNGVVAPVHDRMPLILPREAYALWLDPEVTRPALLAPLGRPFAAELMEAVAVSTLVNRADIDEPACLEPLLAPWQSPQRRLW